MAANWIETITGSLEQKKQYRQYKARIEALPEPYGTAAKAFQRYFMYYGGCRPEGSASAFPLVGVAEDAGFEPARACTQPAFQVCPRPVINVQATPRGGD